MNKFHTVIGYWYENFILSPSELSSKYYSIGGNFKTMLFLQHRNIGQIWLTLSGMVVVGQIDPHFFELLLRPDGS